MTPTPSTLKREKSTSWPTDVLPKRAVDALFARMKELYGTKLGDLWRGQTSEAVMFTWARELADLTPQQLAIGHAALRDRPYVPTCPEFRALCRPKEYVDVLLDFAIAQLVQRRDGTDVWPDPALYWASLRVGLFEMNNLGRELLVKRFAAALETVRREGNVQPVPAAMAALPAPGKATTDKATGRAHLAAILAGRPGRSERSLSRTREALLPIADRPDAVAKLLPDSVLAYAREAEKGAARAPQA